MQTYNSDENRKIIEQLRSDDEKCFDAVYRRYYRALCTYSSRFVTVIQAEELVQDTMMWMWENRQTLIPEMPLKSLLFTIVKNKSLNVISHNTIKSRVIKQLADNFEEEFDDPDFYLESELTNRFTEVLRKMPNEFQQTFRMHRLEGMTHKEIAEQLNVSVQTVNYRIGQTVKVLRKDMEEYWTLLIVLIGIDIS